MTDEARMRVTLYQGVPHQCSYLTDETTTLHIVDPEFEMTASFYGDLLAQGFRRSGDMVYRPGCQQCNACVPARIPVARFRPNRSQKRCLAANSDVDVQIRQLDGFSAIHFELYNRYLKSRHEDGDMKHHGMEEMERFLSCDWKGAELIEGWQDGELVMVAVTDRTPGSLSALYTFFSPELRKQSLGTFGILKQIERCRELGLPFLYLGYWIETCPKMAYKTSFKPLQLFQEGYWETTSAENR